MKENLLKTVRNSRKYTLAVAEAMPDSMYSFQPCEGVWNFNELMNHIAYGITWWESNYVKKAETPWAPPALQHQKEATMALIDAAYDSLEKTLDSIAINNSVTAGISATLDHVTHHRGQAVTYLRCKGITPPEYIF